MMQKVHALSQPSLIFRYAVQRGSELRRGVRLSATNPGSGTTARSRSPRMISAMRG
jgi:hypothetical protein